MRIYTRTGDTGETGLFGGRRISKGGDRVEACGAVHELNAQLGWTGTLLGDLPLLELLREIQADLLTVGADLAMELVATDSAVRLARERVVWLEGSIDRHDGDLPALRNFILPGGSPGAAAIHVCRTVCRRAERSVVRLSEEESVSPAVLAYLNRLSDL